MNVTDQWRRRNDYFFLAKVYLCSPRVLWTRLRTEWSHVSILREIKCHKVIIGNIITKTNHHFWHIVITQIYEIQGVLYFFLGYSGILLLSVYTARPSKTLCRIQGLFDELQSKPKKKIFIFVVFCWHCTVCYFPLIKFFTFLRTENSFSVHSVGLHS